MMNYDLTPDRTHTYGVVLNDTASLDLNKIDLSLIPDIREYIHRSLNKLSKDTFIRDSTDGYTWG